MDLNCYKDNRLMSRHHDDNIINKKFFKLDDAINCDLKTKTAFIISNEIIKRNGNVGRYFTVFPSFTKFIQTRDEYNHCHEILVDHVNNKPNLGGRLVFDLDIKMLDIPGDLKNQMEHVILGVIDKYFHNVDTSRLEFIWSTSDNPNKISKHLTVKHFYFDNWKKMMLIFYKLFRKEWDYNISWANSKSIIDTEIIRNRGSLRMVGSSKIGGSVLTFDNPRHKLMDSLIRIYYGNLRRKEQTVSESNLISGVLEREISDQCRGISLYTTGRPCEEVEPIYDNVVYKKAFELYSSISPGTFEMGKINGNIISLRRIRPDQCILSGRQHESENGYIIVSLETDFYVVKFGCYRRCVDKKLHIIGTISVNNYVVRHHDNYPPKQRKYSKQSVIIQ
jgi:hypothetical protein